MKRKNFECFILINLKQPKCIIKFIVFDNLNIRKNGKIRENVLYYSKVVLKPNLYEIYKCDKRARSNHRNYGDSLVNLVGY